MFYDDNQCARSLARHLEIVPCMIRLPNFDLLGSTIPLAAKAISLDSAVGCMDVT